MLRMTSPKQDMDPFLILYDPNGKEVDRDDDGDGNLNARVTYSCPKTGVYKIRTTVFASTRPGDFALEVRRVSLTQVKLGNDKKGSHRGHLSDHDPNPALDSGPGKRFEITLSRGQSLKVEVESSAFQGLLRVESPLGEPIRQLRNNL